MTPYACCCGSEYLFLSQIPKLTQQEEQQQSDKRPITPVDVTASATQPVVPQITPQQIPASLPQQVSTPPQQVHTPQQIPTPQQAPTPTPQQIPHIMISYNWAVQPTVKRLAAELKTAGYKVWLDIEQMKGSTLEASM